MLSSIENDRESLIGEKRYLQPRHMKIIQNFLEISGWFLGNANLGGPLQLAYKKGEIDEVKSHYHSEVYEYFIVLNGTAMITINGKDVQLKKGSVIVVEPGEKHLLKECSSDFELLLLMDKFIENDKYMIEV